MGITIVQKSDLTKARPGEAKALILAGGAVAGGSFMAGGIKALNDYFDGFAVQDFNIFVGISAGSLIAAPLMGGIPPESILKSLDGTSRHFTKLTAWHYYRPNILELCARPLKFAFRAASWLPGKIMTLAGHFPEWSHSALGAVWRFAMYPSLATYDEMMKPIIDAFSTGDLPSLLGLLPSGIFDNAPIEHYIRQNIERNGLTNDFEEAFRATGKRLYICAMRLDGARRVVFGPDEDNSLSISEAIQASTAMPGFYKPANIRGVDYVDGGVQDTANIDIAVKKGASLIVCYNPFRPYTPKDFVEGFKSRREGSAGSLAASGLFAVLNQIFRAFFHARLGVALDHFRRSPSFKGDIILIEPRPDDAAYFALNPLALKNRVEAARLGFESVRNSIDDKFVEISRIMSAHGIRMSREKVEEKFKTLANPEICEEEIRCLLEGKRRAKAGSGQRMKRIRGRLKRRRTKA